MKTDAQVQRDVMNELKWEPTIHAAEIGVAVKNGVVTLSGTVDTYGKKWAADRAARRVAGVKAVTEEIKVTLAAHHWRADQDIAEAATQVLGWNLWVPRDRVKVIPTAPCLSNDACSAYILLFLLGSGVTSGHRMLATVRGKTMRFFDCHVWV